MRESRVPHGKLVFAFLACWAVLCSAQDASQRWAEVRSRYAAITIETLGEEAILHIRNLIDGTVRKNHFFTRGTDPVAKPLRIEPQCAKDTTCIFRGASEIARIEASAGSETIKISRMYADADGVVTDCYALEDDIQWYGGPQMRYQHWPIQHMYYEEEPYVPSHPTNMATAERYWLDSTGFFILINETSPLFLDQNNILDKHICLVAKNQAPYRTRATVRLDYTLGLFSSPRAAHEHVVKYFFGKPSGYPDERMIQHPIWSTWARYKVNVSETVVNEFADEITAHKFENSQLEIDDNWETCYGSAVFDPVKFPNVTRMTASLKRKGFRVTLWIHPFINEGCEPAYSEALKKGYFAKNLQGQVHMSWWQGANAATIDFTNKEAVTWWVARLKKILQSGIDGFKFDAGESSWLPQISTLNGTLELQPAVFTTDYVTALANSFNSMIEVRVGWKTQKLPIFVRMIDKDTKWTWNNGLPTLITTLLQMNLNGYVHVLPDMIGGNGYLGGSLNATFLPSKELFIRWLQANVFMPSLQYSFVPWDFDNDTIAICRQFTELHAIAASVIVAQMERSVASGEPLNPPVWWIAPKDKEAHKINDAYLMGEDILVSPVTREGATTKDVYLPSGTWADVNQNRTVKGPIWLRNYPAPLNVLPFFIKTVNGTIPKAYRSFV